MRLQISGLSRLFRSLFCANSRARRRQPRLFAASLFLAAFTGPLLAAQPVNQIRQAVDTSRLQALSNHHPLWANSANSTGLAPADLALNQLTLVLARSAQQEQAFQQFLADQQNPASPDYHHWLTPAEVGDRFGLSDSDLATITAWLQSQGLHVTWVAPSRIFVGFSGAASDVGRAFQTQMRTYSVNGQQRLSVSSDPMLPAALTPAIKAIRGLYTINEQPTNHVNAVSLASPLMNASGGTHYIAPADFSTIYDVPASLTGAGTTIGIVGWSRTNAADLDNFKSKTGASFADPIQVVPTAYGGIDPGPALTAPPSGSGSSSALSGQSEATLDVIRAGSVAQGATLLLVVSSPSGANNDGIGADAQYLVSTTPVVQVMSISFGACESSSGSAGVAYWNTLFQSAAAEGISVFVSSGDSGAAGCDNAFTAPPSSPPAISPNYICSSSYATCVGGTQFADTASPSTYWSSTNGASYLSALSYIPEGAWNESSTTWVAATGGGVSSYIATPSWQTGAGVPSARAGRYTPDVSFSASGHDGYFACMAALNGSCTGSPFNFVAFSGTSAAAPGMAGVAALLDQKLGSAQGNLNPQIYPLAASTPTAFHDTTPSTSGVTSCSVNTASMCNNSITRLSGSGAQPGYALTTGYDEATGLGSLNVSIFLNNFATATITKTTPTITWATPAAINYGTPLSATQLNATASVAGAFAYNPSPGAYLGAGPQTLFVLFTPTDTTDYNTASAGVALTVNKATPTITWATPAAINDGTPLSATQLNATASVPGTFVYNPAAGTVLSAGSQTLSVTFTPTDTIDYNSATASVTLTVSAVSGSPTFTVSGTAVTIATPGATSGNTSTITVTPTNSFTGSVTLAATVTPARPALNIRPPSASVPPARSPSPPAMARPRSPSPPLQASNRPASLPTKPRRPSPGTPKAARFWPACCSSASPPVGANGRPCSACCSSSPLSQPACLHAAAAVREPHAPPPPLPAPPPDPTPSPSPPPPAQQPPNPPPSPSPSNKPVSNPAGSPVNSLPQAKIYPRRCVSGPVTPRYPTATPRKLCPVHRALCDERVFGFRQAPRKTKPSPIVPVSAFPVLQIITSNRRTMVLCSPSFHPIPSPPP